MLEYREAFLFGIATEMRLPKVIDNDFHIGNPICMKLYVKKKSEDKKVYSLKYTLVRQLPMDLWICGRRLESLTEEKGWGVSSADTGRHTLRPEA